MNFPTKRVLITGGSGFIGANLVMRLLKEGYEVHLVLRNGHYDWRLKYVYDFVSVYEHDLQDLDSLRELCEHIQPDFIFHLAAFGSYSKQADLFQMIQTNIIGTSNLLEATKEVPYSLFVTTGSSSEYGFKKTPMKESDVLTPNSYYSATKGSTTLISQAFAHLYNKPIAIFRLFSVYGPYEEPGRFIPGAIFKALLNRPLQLIGGHVSRDFVFVEDVVNAYFKAMQANISPGSIFNICSGHEYILEDVAELIRDKTGGRLEIIKGAFESNSWSADRWIGDNEKAVKVLNWSPQYSIERGIEKTIEWARGNMAFV